MPSAWARTSICVGQRARMGRRSRVHQLQDFQVARSYLLSARYLTKAHNFFSSGHFLITIHASYRDQAIGFYVKREKTVCGKIALKNELVPGSAVTYVGEADIELSGPEEGHSVVGDLFSR